MLSPSRVTCCCILSVVAAAGGCQREPTWNLAAVEGTVTLAGQPLAGVRITFLADVEAGTSGPRASGITDDVGHYELRTDAGDLGAAVGQYRVCIHVSLPIRDFQPEGFHQRGTASSKPDEATAQKNIEAKGGEVPLIQVPAIYGRINETPLRAEVRPGGIQTIDFNIP